MHWITFRWACNLKHVTCFGNIYLYVKFIKRLMVEENQLPSLCSDSLLFSSILLEMYKKRRKKNPCFVNIPITPLLKGPKLNTNYICGGWKSRLIVNFVYFFYFYFASAWHSLCFCTAERAGASGGRKEGQIALQKMLRVQRVSAERGFSVSEKLWKAYSKPLKNTHEKSKVCSMTVTTGYLLAAVSCDTHCEFCWNLL